MYPSLFEVKQRELHQQNEQRTSTSTPSKSLHSASLFKRLRSQGEICASGHSFKSRMPDLTWPCTVSFSSLCSDLVITGLQSFPSCLPEAAILTAHLVWPGKSSPQEVKHLTHSPLLLSESYLVSHCTFSQNSLFKISFSCCY